MPLLDRLQASRQPRKLVEDIALNLSRVLNTRRGIVPQDAGLGLAHRPALQLDKDSVMAEDLIQAIQQQLHDYEPRLQRQGLTLEVVGKQLLLTAYPLGHQTPAAWLLSYQTDNYLSVTPYQQNRGLGDRVISDHLLEGGGLDV